MTDPTTAAWDDIRAERDAVLTRIFLTVAARMTRKAEAQPMSTLVDPPPSRQSIPTTTTHLEEAST